MATDANIQAFHSYNDLARQAAASGQPVQASQFYTTAQLLWINMGRPSAFADDLRYTHAIVYGGNGSAEDASGGSVATYQQGQELTAAGAANQPSLVDLAIGDIPQIPVSAAIAPALSLLPGGAPGPTLDTAINKAAATGRAFGLDFGPPQSGREQTTAPVTTPVDLLKKWWWIPAGLAALVVATRR